MKNELTSICNQIKETDFLLFKKADVTAFIKREAEILSEGELTSLFDDIYAFNAYLAALKASGGYDALVDKYYPGIRRYFPDFFASVPR